ncbi:MAG: amidohydrolase family protein [Anaerolineae bacterium]|nr:amidohydrolase family protein [Anaerolineae bacterium]
MIVDAHTHLDKDGHLYPAFLKSCAEFDVQYVWCSCVGLPSYIEYPTVEEVRQANEAVRAEMRRLSGFMYGYVYVNPRLGAAALDEFKRGLDAGMHGLKLWVACRHSDPLVFPLIEYTIERKVPALLHAWRKAGGNEPGHSVPLDVAELARRYPEAKLIMAHLGGDWEHGIKAVRDTPNVLVDICMSVVEAGQVEMAVRELGHERVVFGSDGPANDLRANIGKLQGAYLSSDERRAIESGNMLRLVGGKTP